MDLADWPARARHECAEWVARHRLVFLALSRIRGRRHAVCDGTRIVIEGFPRSGNSFAVRAFHAANPGVAVASHTHAGAQVSEAVRRRLPTIVLLRDPEQAVRSLLVRRPELSAARVIRSYVEYYELVARRFDGLIISPFSEVTQAFGRTIERANQRFGTDFRPFLGTPEASEAIFRAMDEFNRAAWGGRIRVTHVPRPDSHRDRLKQEISLAGCDAQLVAAQRIHDVLLEMDARRRSLSPVGSAQS